MNADAKPYEVSGRSQRWTPVFGRRSVNA